MVMASPTARSQLRTMSMTASETSAWKASSVGETTRQSSSPALLRRLILIFCIGSALHNGKGSPQSEAPRSEVFGGLKVLAALVGNAGDFGGRLEHPNRR